MMFASGNHAIDHGGPDGGTAKAFPRAVLDGSIVDRFEDIAGRFATQCAVSDSVRSFTYAELAVLVDRIADATAAATADRAGPVAILLAMDAYFPAALLGVLAAGRGYVPLDVGAPLERNRLIATHAGVAAVVSAGDAARALRSVLPEEISVVDIHAPGDVARSRRRPGSRDLAYIIYTSGSTGTPRGVYQNHRNVLYDIGLNTTNYGYNPKDRFSLARSAAVIGATRDVLLSLLNGASVHVLPPLSLGLDGLIQALQKRKITIFRSPPTLMRRMAEAMPPGQRLDNVRLVQLVSERMDWEDYDIVRRVFGPGVLLRVGLGSTEFPIAGWLVDASVRATSTRMPVGAPHPDRTVSIVDERGVPVPDGEVGEFVVKSRYAALGYWRDPEATAKSFAVDPADPDVRIFKPGDFGRRRPDGLLEFVGRKDGVIKLRGHRIALAEIESALANLNGIKDAAVLVRRNGEGLPRSLAAYVELDAADRGLQPADIIRLLAGQLPSYMVPPTIVVLAELPRLPYQKINRVRLAKMDADRAAQPFGASDDPMVSDIAGIFEEVIGVTSATSEDNIASLGGDSLQSIRIALAIEKRFGVLVPPDIFNMTRSIGALAAWVTARDGGAGHSA